MESVMLESTVVTETTSTGYVECAGNVDNFICFGTDNPSTDCAGDVRSDYMYRIIGIDPSSGDLKLIRNTAMWEGTKKTFEWNNQYTSSACAGEACEWPYVELYKRLNGTSGGSSQGSFGDTNLFIDSSTSNVQYIKSTGSADDTKWYNMIKDTNWLYGDVGEGEINKTADEMYDIETGSKSTKTGYNKVSYTWKNTIQAKIGLMYFHDYYYSREGSGETNCYSNYNLCTGSWLNIGKNGKSDEYSNEWIMTRYGRGGTGSVYGWGISSWDRISNMLVSNANAVRPVFYLDSTKAKISGGTGTVDSPFVVVSAT